ncbi:hypothetical protein [Methanococcus voltae]|uniref:Uncharacterized protein n=1 Tax=Methanococcus voltae (strain ATCC BAA-1334 / A3) TaxID=456320 RepID=D7DTN9_METV3|nr:hypothetical protein [Methanococcus voltae]MCS3901353.1 hypothetical protein [Methanococcus voltae]
MKLNLKNYGINGKNKYFILCILLVFFLATCNIAPASSDDDEKDNLRVKLIEHDKTKYREELEYDGTNIVLDVVVENIPTNLGYSERSDEKDGGCKGLDVLMNYSEEYLKPVSFNWSEDFKDTKLKRYKMEDGKLDLSISFEDVVEKDFILGTIIYTPIKAGETELTMGGDITSNYGLSYNGNNPYYKDIEKVEIAGRYPSINYYDLKLDIKKEANYTGETKTTEKVDESSQNTDMADSSSLNIRVNQGETVVHVQEINVSQIEPKISVNVDTETVFDIKLVFLAIGMGLISGVAFGLFSRFGGK